MPTEAYARGLYALCQIAPHVIEKGYTTFEPLTLIKNQVCLVLMRKLCRVKIELKILYANRNNYLNCFLTCVLAGV